jgi:molybdopterin-containing oxidoreductase family iron-sulfur binding subunit
MLSTKLSAANGYTLSWAAPFQTRQGVESDMTSLIADIDAGKVGALIVYDVNPAYDYYDAEKFKAAIKKVKVSISFNEKLDETTELCKYILPSNHYLESWGDAEPKAGYVSMIQPTINPLFKTRQYQESLLKWSGNNTSYHDYFKNYWTTKLGGNNAYVKALQDGVIEPAATIMVVSSAAFNGAKVADATTAISGARKSTGIELVLYQKVTIGDGKQANNPWLQETPDPITKITWDNYVMISPSLGKQLFDVDITNPRSADPYEVNPEKQVVKVKAGGGKEVELPAIIIPGMEANTIAIAVGYGRSEKIGIAANGVGKNVFGFARFNGTGADWNAGTAVIEKTGGIYRLAQTQTHHSYEGRLEVVKETTLEEFKKNPKEILEEREKETAPYGGLETYDEKGTIYPHYERPGIKWGMSIDMNACYGCGACVVACTAENNVSIVGKSEVLRAHEMHWLRIDRYFSGDPNDADNIQTLFQPMLCQHCDNAPCENVCPVAATNHSSEGLNQMTYNRCIGTRYCANNCPYKVRRFNWGDYTGADSFPDNQHPGSLGDKGHLDPAVFMMNDDLTRMVLNPDVTVRSRGVIEKCSFCVQRLQEGKLKAKKENRVLADSDIKNCLVSRLVTETLSFLVMQTIRKAP